MDDTYNCFLLSFAKLYELKVVDCGEPAEIANAKWSGGTTYNREVTYTCDTGFSATAGTATRTCLANGSWSESDFMCLGEGLNR